MKNLKTIITTAIASLLIFSGTTRADDLDIYATTTNQNLLLVFDTSLSMSRLETFNTKMDTYDPTFIYPKSNNGYDPYSIYVSQDGLVQSGLLGLITSVFDTVEDFLSVETDNAINSLKRYRIQPSSVECPAVIDAIYADGLYYGGEITRTFSFFSGFRVVPPTGAFKLWDSTDNAVISGDQNNRWYGTEAPEVSLLGQIFDFIGNLLSLFTLFEKLDPKETDTLQCMNNTVDGTGATQFMKSGTGEKYTSSSSEALRDSDWRDNFFNIAYSGNYLNYELIRSQLEIGILNLADITLDFNDNASRLGITRSALINAMNAALEEDVDINIGMMRFDINLGDRGGDGFNPSGGFVDIPMAPLADNKQDIINKVLRYHPDDATPLTETMHEAMAYITGGQVNYGLDSASYWLGEEEPIQTFFGGTPVNDTLTDFISGWFGGVDRNEVPTPSVKTLGQYKSTIELGEAGLKGTAGTTIDRGDDRYYVDETYYGSGENYSAPTLGQCGETQLILFTDGAPQGDIESNSFVRGLFASEGVTSLPNELNPNCSGDGGCAEELAYYMANYDLDGDDANSTTLNIRTHVVAGFMDTFFRSEGAATAKLKSIADAGNGRFYEANDYEQLEAVFTDILTGFVGSTTTFSSPSLSVDSSNQLQLSDELYFPLFDPDGSQGWSGNLKRYQLIDDNGSINVGDVNGTVAVDDNGEFIPATKSFWSQQEDGASVQLGGAANALPTGRKILVPNDSNVLQDVSANLISLGETVDSLVNVVTNTASALLSDDLLGLSGSDIDREALLAWIGGAKSDGTQRFEMEDPLHSSPIIANYSESQRAVFIGTNSGYLHAINPDNGEEYFSFVPRELLRNAKYYYSGQSIFNNKRYGLDGPMTLFHDDKNFDGFVNGSDTVTLYLTMRRGGQSLYALDITDLDNPSLKWTKHGDYSLVDWDDINAPEASAGFEKLGQTWSAARLGLMKVNGDRTPVLFMGAGFDPKDDLLEETASRIDHDIGNTIYILNALTGDIIWDASLNNDFSGSDVSSMTSAFTSSVRPIDRDGDSFVDLLYAADLGGRIWRFDFSDISTEETIRSTGGLIFDANTDDSGVTVANRHFFADPDVFISDFYDVETATSGSSDLSGYQSRSSDITISIGSGWRAKPRSTSQDDFLFVIRDINGRGLPTTYQSVKFSELVEISAGNDITTTLNLKGVRIPMEGNGEKILGKSMTFKGEVFFSAYTPYDANTAASCEANLGTSKLYRIDLTDSRSITATIEKVWDASGIPSAPTPPLFAAPSLDSGSTGAGENQTLTCDDVSKGIMVGTQVVTGDFNACNIPDVTYWRELSDDTPMPSEEQAEPILY